MNALALQIINLIISIIDIFVCPFGAIVEIIVIKICYDTAENLKLSDKDIESARTVSMVNGILNFVKLIILLAIVLICLILFFYIVTILIAIIFALLCVIYIYLVYLLNIEFHELNESLEERRKAGPSYSGSPAAAVAAPVAAPVVTNASAVHSSAPVMSDVVPTTPIPDSQNPFCEPAPEQSSSSEDEYNV
jgi:Ca2+/Na+ antiporter